MFRRLVSFALLIGMVLPLALRAQAPQAIESALADLSQQVGRTVSLNDLALWSYTQGTYPDASLGCPQPGAAYAAVLTPGLQFLLTYEDTVYDYRVSADRQIVILCSAAPVSDSSPAAAPGARITAENAPLLGLVGNFGGLTGASALAPDGKTAVLGSPAGEVMVYNAQTGALLSTTLPVHPGGVSAVAFGAGGRLLATAGADGLIVIWDAAPDGGLRERARLGGASGAAYALAFSPDGRLLAAGGEDRTVRLWAVGSGGAVTGMTMPQVALPAQAAPVVKLVFSEDGTLLFSAGSDGSAAVWGVVATVG